MPAFDTSVLVALVDRGHAHHAKAKEAFRGADDVQLHPCVLAEFTTLVRRIAKDAGEDGNEAARRALASLLSQPRVRIVHDVRHDAAVELYLAVPALSFTDAVLCEASAAGKGEAVTFDKGLHAGRRLSAKERAKRAERYVV